MQQENRQQIAAVTRKAKGRLVLSAEKVKQQVWPIDTARVQYWYNC